MTSLSIRKVQELAAAGKIDGAAKLGDGTWEFDTASIRAWIKREERAVSTRSAAIRTSERAAAIRKASDRLLSAEEILANAIPAKVPSSGIYFLINRGKVAYVGQSRNIATRLMTHVADKRFDHWFWIPCPISDLSAVERAYINALMPRLNKDWTTKRARKAKPPA